MDLTEIGKRLKYVRVFIMDMNQKDFAIAVGATQTSISKWENGKTLISTNILMKISELTGKDTDWLLARKNFE